MRVAIAEDSVLLREGLTRLLGDAGFDVVGRFGNADDLLSRVRSDPPDVVIVDIRLPPTHSDEGLRAALHVRERYPSVGVLVLSQYVEVGLAMTLLSDSAEGVGYLLKNRINDVKDFLAAVRRVAAGGSALDPQVIQRMVGRRRASSPLDELTPRESAVMALMAEGRSNGGIAAELTVTVAAVERHVTSIFDKLGLHQAPEDHRRVLAVLEYLKRG
jgi:DNA-binding NarL/FixJ family response regulator